MPTLKKATPNRALQHAIIDSGKTQRKLSRAARIDETRFSQIVRGRGPMPSIDEQYAISKALRVSVANLFLSAEEAVAS